MNSPHGFYTTFEASHLLGVSLPTVVNWIKADRLKAHRTPGGHRRIAREEIASFIRRHGMPMPEELVEEGAAARVLIVEDVDGDPLQPLVEGAGFRCLTVGSPFAAGLAIWDFKPDLVLFRLVLPGFEPRAAIAQLRANPLTCRIAVVASGGDREEKALRRARSQGFDGVLHLPLAADLIKGELDRALRSQPAA